MSIRRTLAAAALLALAASVTGCASGDETTADDFAGTWTATDIDATLDLQRDDWTVVVSGDDADLVIARADEAEAMWKPEVYTQDSAEYVEFWYQDEDLNEGFSGQIYFSGSASDPRLTVTSFVDPGETYDFVRAG